MLLDQVLTIPGAVLRYLDSPSLEDVRAVLSLYILDFVEKEEVRFHFARFGSLFVSEKSKKCELMEACRVLQLDGNLKERDLDKIKKTELVQVLEPYCLDMIPAEIIPEIQRQKEYLKRVRKVEEVLGQETLHAALNDYYKTLSFSKQAEVSENARPIDCLWFSSLTVENAIPALVKDPERRCGKTILKQLFLLSEREIGKLPYTGWCRRKKYMIMEGLQLAIEKYGSWAGVQAERAKRAARRNRRRRVREWDDESDEFLYALIIGII
jgi:hypothetical protein